MQSAEDKNDRLEERLQQQEEENNQRLHQQEEESNQRLQLQEEEVVRPLQEENQRLRQFEEAVQKERYGPSWSGKTTDIDIIDNLTRLSPLAIHYNAHLMVMVED